MKKNIGIFFGGRSVEHEISIISAMQAMKAIDSEKYDVTPVYISKDGEWFTGNWLRYFDNFRNLKETLKNSVKITPSLNAGEGLLLSYPKGFMKSSKVVAKIDVAFPVFHGAFGEDGCMQGVFELMNIPYVGSGVAASSIGMNKVYTKQICREIDIPVIDFYSVDADSWFADKEKFVSEIEKKFKFPLIVKPNNLGSSIAVSKAKNRTELENAVELVAMYSNEILIERFVTSIREINCSVAETSDGAQVSECEEPVVNSSELLSFEEKYMSTGGASQGMAGSKRKVPADIPEKTKKEIEEYSLRLFKHLDCSGIIRIDYILDEAEKKVYMNEVNTIPGSLSFYLWEAKGIKFADILTSIIENSIKRFSKKNKLKKVFVSAVLQGVSGGKLGGKL